MVKNDLMCRISDGSRPEVDGTFVEKPMDGEYVKCFSEFCWPQAVEETFMRITFLIKGPHAINSSIQSIGP